MSKETYIRFGGVWEGLSQDEAAFVYQLESGKAFDCELVG